MERMELLVLLDHLYAHRAVVEVFLVQVKMVKMVDLVVVHRVADQLEVVATVEGSLPMNQVILVLIQDLKTKVNLVVEEMLHQSVTMALAAVVDSLELVKAVVMVVVTEVLVLI
tara:strand:- start:322 stop:663 length:342 start_codon:yes stop_codon:yes gene_type:complete